MGDDNKATHTIYINCEDTLRYSLASHLSMAFRRKGLSAFVNSKGTQDVIEQGSTFVLLLSINFVSSALCLNKLVRVLEWRMENGLLVVPVFYGVSPSDVVAPEHESADRRREWTNALQELIELPGYHSREEHSDCELVEEIVDDVYEKLFPTEQIGISSRLLEIELLLCKQPWGIRRLGIWGMPGIGKTTLARAFFDQVSGGYEASCFIKHFDKAFRDKGLHRLLAEHFGEILKELPRLCNSFTRPRLPKHKLNKKRTLVILDDVHNPLIAESFLGGFHWFGPGSLIIITSRDKQVFRLCQISHVYEVRSLNMNESLQLFSNCAFEKDMRAQNFMELSKKVTEYANGNPLVLGLYGRELKGKKLLEMETAFLDLKKRTPNKIYDLLKSTFETLNDSEKNIFLDIACFFKGENVNYVMQLFEGCGFFPHDGIDVLVEKCLVTISENTVKMHNLVQAFGQELINGETAQIERRRRLWEPRNIKVLLEDDELEGNGDPEATYTRPLGTEDIEGIFLDRANLIFDVKPGAFENMFNLRFLKIYSSSYKYQYELCLRKGLEYLPYELRLLHWENYPLQSLPQDFDPGHLVELNMPYSHLQKLWGGTKNLERLKMVRLCHSQQLTEIDDICKAQNIELIDLQGCTKLQSFPATGQLKHLRVVNLSGCREINSFPEVSPNIEELHLQGTSIRELPISIVTLSRQDKLNLELSNLLTEFSGVSDALNIEQLTSLVKVVSSNKHLGKLIFLNMKYCSHLRNLPDMVDLESLRVLHLSGCSNLESIQGFPRNLKELYLAGTAIKELPQLPQSLEVLNAHSCVLLKSIPSGFKQLPSYYTFSDCSTLSSQAVSEFVVNVLSNVGSLVREYQQKQELNRSLAFSFMVPSHANNRCTLQPGSSVMIRLGPSWRSMLMGFAMLVEVAFSEEAIDFGLRCVCRWNDKEGVSYRLENTFSCWTGGEGVPKVQKDNLFVFCDLSLHPSCGERKDPDLLADLVVFEFFPVNKQKQLLDGSCTVTKCGVYVITAANEDTSLNMTQRLSSLDHTKKLSGSEAEEELMNIYDGLDMKDKNLFDYILCLFNNEETDVVARHIDSIGLEIGSGFEALADKSLIHISPYGVIVPPHLLQKLGRGIVRRSAWPSTLLPDSSCGSSSSSVVMSKVDMDSDCLDSEILWEDLTIGVRIGLGSCGTVYRGLWFEYDVAVKMFSKQEYSEEVITSFRQEVSFMKKLRHPNVLLILGAVASPRRLCIVTEFLPRGSLFRLLQRNTSKLDWPLRIQMASDIARGMNYLHHCSPPIIHGDLKSSNLLVDRNWTVKVADFGLSRIKYEMYLTTKTGRGTPQWMAPEVLRNEAADEKSDVYSFGVILWELVTEKIPWENLNAMQVIGAVGFMTQRLEVPKDVDPLWISIMESCWHSEPQRRPSFQELMAKLRELKRKYTIQLQEASAASIDNQVASVEQNQNQPFLSISPSVSHRFKSFNLYNNFISQEPITVAEESPPPEAKPEVEEEETNPSIEEVFSNPNVNHVARSNTDTEPASGSIPPKLPKKMKKSASTKSPFPHFENDETYVEAPRPETVRVKRVTTVEEADKEVDAKAAEFINRFKHQLKLQRIDSITKYKEMVKKKNDK